MGLFRILFARPPRSKQTDFYKRNADYYFKLGMRKYIKQGKYYIIPLIVSVGSAFVAGSRVTTFDLPYSYKPEI